MALSEAGHLYNPPPICWHFLRSKCNSVLFFSASWAGGGVDDEHPPSANSPNTASAKPARFAILSPLKPEFLFTIELPPISFDPLCDANVRRWAAQKGRPPAEYFA